MSEEKAERLLITVYYLPLQQRVVTVESKVRSLLREVL